ncbi:MAG: nucleotidyltransferase family protein [Verrucomicrobia bacterium]|nr:nucleotidyltransferase family protein [Verrucomicrobiota bacterium]
MDEERVITKSNPRTVSAESILTDCMRKLGVATHREDGAQLQIENWATAYEALAAHRLLPLAAQVLLPRDDMNIPQLYRDHLSQELRRRQMHHKVTVVMLGKIDALFRENRLIYAVLKGPYLHESYYHGLFVRPYDDVDILVHRRNVQRALDVLKTMGYSVAGNWFSELMMRRAHFHLVLKHESDSLPWIELHWGLVDEANLARIDMRAVLSRVTTFRASGHEIGTLSPEDSLIYLCLHVAKHGLINFLGLRDSRPAEWFLKPSRDNRLVWFIDLMLFLEKEELNWNVIGERSREQNVNGELVETLRLLDLLLPGSRAAEVLASLGVTTDMLKTDTTLTGRLLSIGWVDRLIQASMDVHHGFFFRPVRLLFIGRLLFASPVRIQSYYRLRKKWTLPFFYLIHPLVMLRKQLVNGA